MSDSAPRPGPHIGESVKPRPGDRCSKSGGYWEYCMKYPEWLISEVVHEIRNVIDGLENELDQREAIGLLEDYIAQAELGQLSPADPAEFKPLSAHEPLVEIRVQIRPDDAKARNRILLRLYFAEPLKYPRLMLALKFARKTSGTDVDGTQDRHIRDAHRRYDEGRAEGHTWGIVPRAC